MLAWLITPDGARGDEFPSRRRGTVPAARQAHEEPAAVRASLHQRHCSGAAKPQAVFDVLPAAQRDAGEAQRGTPSPAAALREASGTIGSVDTPVGIPHRARRAVRRDPRPSAGPGIDLKLQRRRRRVPHGGVA